MGRGLGKLGRVEDTRTPNWLNTTSTMDTLSLDLGLRTTFRTICFTVSFTLPVFLGHTHKATYVHTHTSARDEGVAGKAGPL